MYIHVAHWSRSGAFFARGSGVTIYAATVAYSIFLWKSASCLSSIQRSTVHAWSSTWVDTVNITWHYVFATSMMWPSNARCIDRLSETPKQRIEHDKETMMQNARIHTSPDNGEDAQSWSLQAEQPQVQGIFDIIPLPGPAASASIASYHHAVRREYGLVFPECIRVTLTIILQYPRMLYHENHGFAPLCFRAVLVHCKPAFQNTSWPAQRNICNDRIRTKRTGATDWQARQQRMA
ncbi:hypothetical protein AC578_6307 [Pseudocercospora eumusae]|uniref:Uncharacterized protein n=1 Tax=Pseudocercospora eumusae TaxID=321146 RepID=A0A139H243_9PEZI|nr:hypothetical protein AC578_6307 [Pseudocercospora eumusae]